MIKIYKMQSKSSVEEINLKEGYQTRIKPTSSFTRIDKGTFSCFSCVTIFLCIKCFCINHGRYLINTFF